MGMTIDEAIIQANLLKDGISKDTDKYEIFMTLINIAEKYQKIEEIMHIEMNGKEALQEIERILRG